MVSKDDRRAAFVLLGLALVGLVVRILLGGGEAPGGIFYQATEDGRPVRDSLAVQAARMSRPLTAGEKIDVDRATVSELARLPRIGAGLAGRIVADREARGAFGSLVGLDRVPGVGPSVLAAVAPHAEFSGRALNARRQSADSLVRVNSASAEQLARLPGIGPARANAIVQYRIENGPFRKLADLEGVNGIGPAILKQLRTFVVVP